MKRFLLLAGILIGVSAFFYFRTRAPEVPSDFKSALPGRNEICTSGNLRLTMNSYEVLRSRFPEIRPLDRVRVGLYAQWLREKGPSQDSNVLGDAARCIRGLMEPRLSLTALQEIEGILRHSFGLRSLQELSAQIHDAWGGRVVEWNPSLVKEYGLETPETLGNSG